MTCVRCQGLIVDNYGDVHCLNCGYRETVATAMTCREAGCTNIPVNGTTCGACIAKRAPHWRYRNGRGRYTK